MHSNFYFLINCDQNTSQDDLLDEAVSIFEERFSYRLDDNNWYQPLGVVSQNGTKSLAEEVNGPLPDFDEIQQQAARSVINELSMQTNMALGRSPWDVNPFSMGPRGDDEESLVNMTSVEIGQEILTHMPKTIIEMYEKMIQPSLDKDGVGPQAYGRKSSVNTFEMFVESKIRPFSRSGNPYTYPAFDLTDYKGAGQAVLIVDIHT
jgi:hypothetical protein